ncbi:MAG TPA: thioredoxin [Tepidisphaeraceae bacterium]|jgi:thioredoxin
MFIVTCPNCGTRNRIDERRTQTQQPRCGKCGTELPAAATGGGGGGGGGGFGDEPEMVTDATFATMVLQADRPVLLDCWAPWCGPCRMVAPIIDQIAAESGGRFVVAKLNTDENPRTAAQFRIDAIPTMLIFNHGQLVDRIVGLQAKQSIVSRLERAAGAAV